jgi:ubiquinone/menaquinone biosynthesis C-methylase UbiE|tara:strand:- start:300 stop:980 length:681 start_codon:yes stop_codon:yes gene_type:complete
VSGAFISKTSDHWEPPEQSRPLLYKRFFAWSLSKLQRCYGDEIDQRKKELLGTLRGTVVEIGPGAGANLGFYPDHVSLVLVEPNPYMRPYFEEMARQHDVSFEICGGTAEDLDLSDASADFVVSTLVLCSVDDPEVALQEVLRVLKPGGRFIFLEHVAAPHGTTTRKWQGRLRGFWRRICDGCTLDRETWIVIEEAGFATCEIEHFEAEDAPLVKPHIAGIGMKSQ